VRQNEFDTVYHEHFSYLSLTAVLTLFAHNGLVVFDVEELSTHGGSLRVHAQRGDCGVREIQTRVAALFAAEVEAGVQTRDYYAAFQSRADRVAGDFRRFLQSAKASGKRVAAYGAAAKGNTLMNYAGVGPHLIEFVADRNPAKQGKYMPGSHIPIVDESHLQSSKPDYVVILPWNLREELKRQLEYVGAWDGKLVTAIPCLEVA